VPASVEKKLPTTMKRNDPKETKKRMLKKYLTINLKKAKTYRKNRKQKQQKKM